MTERVNLSDPENAKVGRITMYRVEFNTDNNEGRGSTYYEYYVTSAVAHTRAKGRGVMGTDCTVVPTSERVIVIGEKIFRIGDEIIALYEDPEVVRKRALAKLTPEERKALGIREGR